MVCYPGRAQSMAGLDDVDLTNCDREPIHTPGSIQPHGCLLVTDADLRRVLRHSTNISTFLGLPSDDYVGTALDDVFGRSIAHDIRNARARASGPSRPGNILNLALGAAGGSFDVSVHSHSGNCLIEFEGA